jgi:hypothetical protein
VQDTNISNGDVLVDELEGASEVEEDVLHNSEMRLTRIIHVQTHLLDCLGVGVVMALNIDFAKSKAGP